MISEKCEMNTVTLEIANRNLVSRRFLDAFTDRRQGSFISFETPELLFKTLTAKRWELLQVMTGAGPMSIREAARRLQRDVKAVHGRCASLAGCRVIGKEQGRADSVSV